MTDNKIYFRGLNELRAIASLSVIFFHLQSYFSEIGISEVAFMKLGNAGVILFFVLSGFLITYLLLDEKRNNNDISIRHFYVRRILRIWPLYFLYIAVLVLLFVTGVISEKHSYIKLLFYIFFLGTIPQWLSIPGFPLLGHYWSLGVEEQFYAFWPWLIKKSNNALRIIFIVWLVFFSLKIVSRVLIALNKQQDSLLYQFGEVFNFHSMAIGGLSAAVFFYKKDRILKIIYHPVAQIAAWIFLLLTAFDLRHLIVPSIFFQEVFGCSTAIIIINTISNPKPVFRIYNSVLDFLGKISFGLYVYHSLVMYILFTYCSFIFHFTPVLNYAVAHILVILLTTAVSWVSYVYFEKRFLLLKERFS
jgi:peptidoglycan/LPS O-acetylase OafA/YrhL